ncbi:MAG: TRAP transporter substrate-binding protein DctP [Rhodospirillum sp.]|nr:TRAP transporter substrate-binding protein DctP [Rhodospirillum sp.]MCF8490577.1 TRAP transporter substrate-binding protein DctP [Rhodospirillum sp.]MCF8502589.1 TRAP transporter substrate-binding protein DctP [Rhodospirillum sp.]
MFKVTTSRMLELGFAVFMFAAAAMGMPPARAEGAMLMAILAAPDTTGEKAAHLFADRVKELSGGAFNITVNASLFRGNELAPAVRDGRAPMAIGVLAYLSGSEPLMGLTNLPGLIRDVDDYWTVHDALYGDEVSRIWRDSFNAVTLATGTWETNLVFSTKPIHELSDFKGLKIRVSSKEFAQLISTLGASPTPTDISDIQLGLERGILDGLITSSCFAQRQEMHKVARYVSNWGTSTTPTWSILINKGVMAGLPEATQEMLRQAGTEVEERMKVEYQPFVDNCINHIKEDGAEYYVADEAHQEALFAKENTQAIYDAWFALAREKGEDGEAVVARAREVLSR